jgi:glyceraldehyde-3-phosphate dehydrogenase (NADP+)
MKEHKLWIQGAWQQGSSTLEISAPYSRESIARVEQASEQQLEEALAAIALCDQAFRRSSRFARSTLLSLIATGISEKRQDLIDSIVLEAGKPRKLADVEVSRAIQTFTLAAEEVKRFSGIVTPLDLEPAGVAYGPALSSWVARGPVLAISPFNFPLNLVAHKLAPALAVGAPVLLKPAPQTPGAALILAEIFERVLATRADIAKEVPASVFQVIHSSNEVIAQAVKDPRLSVLSFTGSDKVGWHLQSLAQRKKVALELGGNAPVIVHADANISRAAARCAFGAFAYAGQICISVQRIFIHESIYSEFVESLITETAKVVVGDPSHVDTLVGPMINQQALDRVLNWIAEAQSGGAEVLVGGKSKGSVIEPTILAGCKQADKLSCEEVFGPVVVVEKYQDFADALSRCNSSRYGLQAGVFTESLQIARKACHELNFGAVLINEIPTYRADQMPYGGMKDSGIGREGVRYAMEDYSELKTTIYWQG